MRDIVLPDYVTHSPSVSNLVSDKKNGEVYKVNLCLFRCFALDALRRRETDVAISTHLRNLLGLKNYYFGLQCQESKLEPSVENFKGLHLNDLAQVQLSRWCVPPLLNVSERLKKYGIVLLPDLNRFYPFCATYDEECLMKNDVTRADSDKQRCVAEHELISVSVQFVLTEISSKSALIEYLLKN